MKTKLNFNMWIPTRILFGADELKNLHRQQMPGKKALLAISNGKSTRANGYPPRRNSSGWQGSKAWYSTGSKRTP